LNKASGRLLKIDELIKKCSAVDSSQFDVPAYYFSQPVSLAVAILESHLPKCFVDQRHNGKRLQKNEALIFAPVQAEMLHVTVAPPAWTGSD
jgi:hypothetical protein